MVKDLNLGYQFQPWIERAFLNDVVVSTNCHEKMGHR